MDYTCTLDGADINCVITSDRELAAPVFCFSGMAPMTVVSGGDRIGGMGGFTEVALPDLVAHKPYAITLRYTQGFKPANRAWMPLGPYLRTSDELIKLPPTEAGCRPHVIKEAEPFEGLSLLPQPTSWLPTGETTEINGFSFSDPAFEAVAGLAERQRHGSFRGDFPVRHQDAELPEDAYELLISNNDVVVRTGSYGGRFYAGITLLTLMQNGPIACGKMTDAPRFSWRGQHLDTARHFYQPDTIRDLLDLMALLKLNRFHWHFADDEAFRLEIESFPELWRKTVYRGEGHLLPSLFSGDVEAGGSYSKAMAKDIIAHAKTLNIEVMPEIEAPAHAIAITHVYPQTRDYADNGAEISVQGYLGNVVNPAMPKTWEVLEGIVKEVGDLFPFAHLHLGCDELPEGTWAGSPAARALMKREGLETTQDLQGWTMSKLAEMVVKNGQRPAAWEEAAQGQNGGIGHDAILFSWQGQNNGVKIARAGYDVVMTPAQNTYFDMAHSDDPDDWGASWAAFISLSDTINWNPVPAGDVADRIIGVQGAFWSEFTTKDDQLWPMLIPRIFGLAVKAWQARDLKQDEFLSLATRSKLFKSQRPASQKQTS